MWFFLLWLGFAVWVFFDAKKRCMKNPALEAVGVLGLGIIFLPLYFAKRNLYKGEVREGGMAWNAVKVFALYWTITMFVASLAGLGAASQTVVEQTSEAAQAGAAVGTMLGMGLMIGLWFVVLAGTLVIGLFLKKSSMVENGPTGGLAEQENPPKKLGVALLVVWVVISSMAVLVASGKDGGKGEKSSGNTPKTSVSTSAASEPLPALEARFIEIVSAAQGESRRAENDMQRGGIKARRDKALCGVMTSAVTDWIGTIEEVSSNSDGKGVLEIAIAEDIKIKTWNNALSDVGSNTLIEPGSPVFDAASAMKRGQRVAFSGVFFRGSQGDCLQEASMSLRGKLEEPEFIFRFLRVSANIPTQQQVTQQNAVQPVVVPHAAPVQRQEVVSTPNDSKQALVAPKDKERIVKKNLIKAAKTAVAAYKEDGMLGLIAKTQECYSDNGNKFYCVYLDFASKHIDLIMVNEAARQGVSLPKTKFFDDELFWPRIAAVFEGANMSREAGDAYLHSLIPAINKLVNEVIFREG